MEDNRKISICIPTYNRLIMTIESFAKVIDDPRVSEIVICDDASTDNSYDQLLSRFMDTPKVALFRNLANQDCYWNKRITIEHATNDWCILLDSDNIIGTDYLDAIYAISEWVPEVVYQPIFAKPHFDFRHLRNRLINRLVVGNYLQDDKFTTALNAMNFFINRQTYLNAFDPSQDPVTSDSIYMAYRLLQQGNTYYFTPGLEYEHRVGHASHYTTNINRTPKGFHQSVLDKLAAL